MTDMTTQELVERLRNDAQEARREEDHYSDKGLVGYAAMFAAVRQNFKDAADRLSEMDAEIKRLREALNETIIDLNVYSDIGIIRARTIERRAALEHQQKEE